MSEIPETPETLVVSRRRLPRGWILAGALLILIGVGLAVWLLRPRQPDFTTLSLQPETLVETIDVSGTIESERVVQLKAGVSVRVLRRAVAENQRVAAGTPLLKLDVAALNLQLQQSRTQTLTSQRQAQSELDSAAATISELEKRRRESLVGLRNQVQRAEENLFFLERELTRQENLLAEAVVTAQSVDQQRQQVTQARRELTQTQNSLATAERTDPELVNARNRLNQARTSIENARRTGAASVALAGESLRQAGVLAPFNGEVTNWSVQKGDLLTPGSPIGRFQDLKDLRLILAVNELDFPKIRLGAAVEISFDAYPDRRFRGSVVWRSQASMAGAGADTATAASTGSASAIQVFPIKVWFQDPEHLIKPGMSGDARITVSRRQQVLAVPIGAIKKQEGHYTVRVLKDGKPVETKVTVGSSTLDKVEIRSGLKAGDQLVIDQAASPSASPSSPS